MSESTDRSRTDEASRWFTELKRPTVSAQALHDFREWRRDEANAAAFAKVEKGWEASAALKERPNIQAATEAALAANPPRPGRTKRQFSFAPIGVALASLMVIGGGALIAAGQLEPSYTTEIGGQRLEQLKDGSRVRLNTNTKIVVRYRDGERRIELVRGEAFFEVAHDAARPFIVETNGTEVRALGTKFDVRRDASSVQVTLIEGRVQVRADGHPATATLTPSQALTVTASGISVARPANTELATGWTTGRLTFRGLPLQAAIREVNRYSTRKIVLTENTGVANEPVSGQFEPGDTATFLAAVEAVLGLKVTSQTEREILLAPGAGPA